jgi:uncharacterized protein (DUF1499 family)
MSLLVLMAILSLAMAAGNSPGKPVSLRDHSRSSITASLAFIAAVSAVPISVVSANADVIGVDKSGLFALCPEASPLLSSCVSSQDDRPAYFVAPWCYDGTTNSAKRKLLDRVLSTKGSTIVKVPSLEDADRLVVVEFKNEDGSIDDAQFYFTPNDSTVQFRSISRASVVDFGRNRNRLESMRISLHLESVPILRNRKRVLFFVESPLDEFGPPTNSFDRMVESISGKPPHGFDISIWHPPTLPLPDT